MCYLTSGTKLTSAIITAMYKNKKILCIIPARKNSQGLKNKNIKIIYKRPLIYWPISAAKKSKIIDHIFVSTDSNIIKKLVSKYKVDCPYLRPKKLGKNNSRISDVIIHTLNYFVKNKIHFDYFILLEPTSPLTNNIDIDKMLIKLIKRQNFTSLVSITKNITAHPIFNLRLNKKNDLVQKFLNGKIDQNRQKISELYYLSGNAYISKISTFLNYRSFIQKKTLGYKVDKWKSSEIDDLVDFIKTQALMKYLKLK